MAGFLAILALCIGVVGLGYFQASKMQKTMEFFTGSEVPILKKYQQLTGETQACSLLALQLYQQGKNPDLEQNYNNARDNARNLLDEIKRDSSKIPSKEVGALNSTIDSTEEILNGLFERTDFMIVASMPPTVASSNEAMMYVRSQLEGVQGQANTLGDFFKTAEDSRIKGDLQSTLGKVDKAIKFLSLLIILLGLGFTYFISTSISNPIGKLVLGMTAAERGILETRINLESKDEFGKLADNFNRMLEGICQMIAKVMETSNDLATSSQELSSASVESAATLSDISKNVNEINTSAVDIAGNLEKTSVSIEQFSESAHQVASLAETAVQAANTTQEAAHVGGHTVKKSVDMIGKIKESVDMATQVILDLNSMSKQIGEIVNTITTIASQTNLLALNAAIEAARAGEQGKGFTVVADEVRKLAEASAEAAELIGSKIEDILTKTQNAVDSMQMGRSRVDEGIRVVREVSSSLDNIIANINDVNKKIKDISKISAEQSRSSEMMSHTIEDITKLTKQTSERTGVVATSVEQQTTTVSQISNSTEDLARLADELHSLVSRFTIAEKKER